MDEKPGVVDSGSKSAGRPVAALLILLEVAGVAGLQWLRSQGAHLDLPLEGGLPRFLHFHAFHFRDWNAWLLIHAFTVATGWAGVALGSPIGVRRVTHAVTLLAAALALLLLASCLRG